MTEGQKIADLADKITHLVLRDRLDVVIEDPFKQSSYAVQAKGEDIEIMVQALAMSIAQIVASVYSRQGTGAAVSVFHLAIRAVNQFSQNCMDKIDDMKKEGAL
jgi:hypothetical protein